VLPNAGNGHANDSDSRPWRALIRSRLGLLALVTADILAVLAANILAFVLHFDTVSGAQVYSHLSPYRLSLALSLVVYVVAFQRFRLYRYAWRFASLGTMRSVLLGCTVGLWGLVALQFALGHGHVYRPSLVVMVWLLSVVLVGGLRVLLRLSTIARKRIWPSLSILRRDTPPRRALILGGGPDGARLLTVLSEEMVPTYEVVGFLDDHRERHGSYIRSVRVLGPYAMAEELVEQGRADEVIVAAADLQSQGLKDAIMACRRHELPVKIVPQLREMLNSRSQLRMWDVSVEDLLRRAPVGTDNGDSLDYVAGARVLVTGAGGSIGSELCRQIMAIGPSQLILLGHGENSIHRVHGELAAAFPAARGRLHMVIASVVDELRMREVLEEFRPQIVFHAAAHKHVPIMETNAREAVQNNVYGTRNVAEACGESGVELMVQISTDKAVYPTSVMGATKYLAEQAVRALAGTYAETRFITVRFGNVLGSRGSVVPIFKGQIERGGPITVTHPDVTRYFMTIPEAVHLVLQAGAIGRTGDLFILNMGQPVRIVDLAQDMIRLSGGRDNESVQIVFTGLRPGERLHEQLSMDDEVLEPAERDGLRRVSRAPGRTDEEMRQLLGRLAELRLRGTLPELLAFVADVVPSRPGEGLIAAREAQTGRRMWDPPRVGRSIEVTK